MPKKKRHFRLIMALAISGREWAVPRRIAADYCSQLLPSLDGVSAKRLKVGCAADFAVIPVWWNLRFA